MNLHAAMTDKRTQTPVWRVVLYNLTRDLLFHVYENENAIIIRIRSETNSVLEKIQKSGETFLQK